MTWLTAPSWGSSETTLLESKAIIRYEKNIKIHQKKAKHLSDIAPPPLPGEQYLIITEKQFNAFAMIVNVIEENIIDELYLAIYRINEPTVSAIINFIESGRIKKGAFIISNFFNQTKKPEQWAKTLREFCENSDQFHHAYVHNHAKVVCIKSGDNYYVFEGSGNLSDNARIEQYRYDNSKEVYNFHKSWINQLAS